MRIATWLLAAACFGLAATSPATAQTVAEAQTNIIIKLLNGELIDTASFTTSISLLDATGLIYEKIAAKGLDVPIVINRAAFRAENPESNVNAFVSVAPFPKRLPIAALLRALLAELPTPATFIIRETQVEIVPEKSARVEELLKQKVLASFKNRPLTEVAQELSFQTGMSINIDEQNDAAKRLVTATFRNDVTLRDALVMLTRMAGLEMELMPSAVFIKVPATQVAP